MRAQFIYEKFKEESDPIKDMGIGIERQRDFENKEEITKWILKHLKYILKVKEIPKDIIDDGDHFIKYEYLMPIQQFCSKHFTVLGQKQWASDVYPDWQYMRELFINKGYPTPDIPKNLLSVQ
jgi:hypothetical protein